jgi:hypothetical protein
MVKTERRWRRRRQKKHGTSGVKERKRKTEDDEL